MKLVKGLQAYQDNWGEFSSVLRVIGLDLGISILLLLVVIIVFVPTLLCCIAGYQPTLVFDIFREDDDGED